METFKSSNKVVQASKVKIDPAKIEYVDYAGEHHLPLIMNLVDQELSEPYSIFTYRYFVYLWPKLCFLAFDDLECVGTVVCKMGDHHGTMRGYIAMLVVLDAYRGKGIATELVTRSIMAMIKAGCEEVALEAEVTNKGALALYGRLGFIRAKRLYHYYLNGVDAFRLKLLFPPKNRVESSDTSDAAAALSSASGIGEEASRTTEYANVSVSCPSYSSVDQITSSGTSDDPVQLPAISTSDAAAQLPTSGTSDDIAVQISSSGISDAAAAQRPTCGTSDDTAAQLPASGTSEDAIQLPASCASSVAAVQIPASDNFDDAVQIPTPVMDEAARASGL